MAVARTTMRQPSKAQRIAAHIENLKGAIKERFPKAEFQVGPVPESNWPGLWVRCDAAFLDDVTAPLTEMQEEFFLRENMDVHVIVE